jgi:hypothetical protein
MSLERRVDTDSNDAEDLLTTLNVEENAQVEEEGVTAPDGTVEVDGDIR